jgi:hypothetical protein
MAINANCTKMKKITLFGFSLLFMGLCVKAVPIAPFPGWNALTDAASEIAIVQCERTSDPFHQKVNGMRIDMQDGLIPSSVEIVSVLKGSTNSSPTNLISQYWPRQGEYYLVFGDLSGANYQAIETYRIVPLGMGMPRLTGTNTIDKVHSILRFRLKSLKREMDEREQEKNRLEEAFPKTNSVSSSQSNEGACINFVQFSCGCAGVRLSVLTF